MPIYEYRCNECYEVTERIESFESKTITILCPFCSGISNRMISLSSFHLKGGGWFKDGYGIKESETKEESVKTTDKKPVETKPLADSE